MASAAGRADVGLEHLVTDLPSALMSSITQNPRPCVATMRSCRTPRKSRTDVTGRIALEGLPVVALVERHERPALGAGEQQPPAQQVFLDHVEYTPAGRPPVMSCQERP